MTKNLELIYQNDAQKPVKFQIPDVKEPLTEETVRHAMETLISLNVLNPSNGKITGIKSAQIVEKTTNVIFE